MKRSVVNANILWAKELLTRYGISLPEFANWGPEEWIAHKGELDTIRRVYLGWDVKDYSEEMGSVLFTIRNGRYDDPSVGVPYCEKVILFRDGKRLPLHYHKSKTEDIINRAGGTMQIRLYATDARGKLTDAPISVYQDGILHTYQPGELVFIEPGGSITLEPGVAHTFGPKPGSDLIVGEVSKINDDFTDNYRFEKIPAPCPVEEDAPMLHPLCTEYEVLLADTRQ